MVNNNISKLTGLKLTYEPRDDGITHINAYIKGRTQLGKELSNFAQIGFTHPEYGKFGSIEAFWYWLSTGKQYEHLKPLFGFKAKEEGRKFARIKLPEFRTLIEEAIVLKIKQNLWLYEAMKQNKLPITHYFVFGTGYDLKAVQHETTPWLEYFYARFISLEWGSLKETKAKNVVIAGSRSIKDYQYICDSILMLWLNIKSIISGGATGVDTLAKKFAEDRNIPFKEFKADWDKYGKTAGFIRNEQMGQEGDELIAIWDGHSNGTKHMKEFMSKIGKPTYLIINNGP